MVFWRKQRWRTLPLVQKAEKVNGVADEDQVSGNIKELVFDYSAAMEKDKIYYLSDDETKIGSDIKTGKN